MASESRFRKFSALKPNASSFGFVLLVVVSWIVLYPLVDQNYLYIFEPDARATVDLTIAFSSGEAFFGQPKPSLYPPYFDAQFFLYALSILATKSAVAVGAIDPAQLPTSQSFAIFAIRNTNVGVYSIGVGIAFLIFFSLSADLLLAIVLAMFVLLSPQMLSIDFLRVDHVVATLFLAALLLTLTIGHADARNRPFLHGLFGVVTASLCLTKVNSIVFLALPIMVYVTRIRSVGFFKSGTLWFVISFGLFALLLLARFIPHEIESPSFTFQVAFAKAAEVARWATVFSKHPLLFYNIDQFQIYGPIVMAFAAVAVLRITFGQLASEEGAFEDAVLVSSFLLLSVFGVLSFKYPRGLYVLAPIYLALIARAHPLLSASLANMVRIRVGQPVARASLIVILAFGLYWPVQEYVRLVGEADHRPESTREVRTEPREWLQSNIATGARVTVLAHSDWANPPIEGLGYAVDYRYLAFPYLNSSTMASYRPPTLEQVLATTDAILLNSFHYDFHLNMLSKYGYSELRKDWEDFFAALRSRFPVKRFATLHPSYGVKWVEVIVIR